MPSASFETVPVPIFRTYMARSDGTDFPSADLSASLSKAICRPSGDQLRFGPALSDDFGSAVTVLVRTSRMVRCEGAPATLRVIHASLFPSGEMETEPSKTARSL